MPKLTIFVNSNEVASVDTAKFIRSRVSVLSANEAEDIDILSAGYLGGDEVESIINKKIRHNDEVDIFLVRLA